MELNEPFVSLHLPMERPLFSPPSTSKINDQVFIGEANELVPEALFNQIIINKPQLILNIKKALNTQHQISLKQLIHDFPLQQGLAELIVYLSIAVADKHTVFDDSEMDLIPWVSADGLAKQVTLARIIFTRTPL